MASDLIQNAAKCIELAAAALCERDKRIAEQAAERDCLIIDYQNEHKRAERAEAECQKLRALLVEFTEREPYFDSADGLHHRTRVALGAKHDAT